MFVVSSSCFFQWLQRYRRRKWPRTICNRKCLARKWAHKYVLGVVVVVVVDRLLVVLFCFSEWRVVVDRVGGVVFLF